MAEQQERAPADHAREVIRQSLRLGAPGLAEPAREAIVRSIMLKLEGNGLLGVSDQPPASSGKTLTGKAQGLERVRHVKSGSEYEVLGEAEAQIATRSTCPDGPGNGVLPNSSTLHEGDKLTVYRGSGGKLWCRFTDEFRDGRFVPVPPASSGQEG